ncbi:MAG: hypothetical protein ABSC61_11220 [Anaerolineales bacterium]
MKRFWNSGCLIGLLGVWLAFSTGAVVIIALAASRPNFRAEILMGAGLVLLWVGLGGFLTRRLRDPVRDFLRAIRIDWRIKFVLLATILALVEETITTGMTNLAPFFGVPVGAAYITASANFFDVVCFHSVVVFIPMFAGWAVLLGYFEFSPNAVFLLFGLTGTMIETLFSGPQGLAEFGLWIFVYGLMVYLPAYTLPAERGAKRPPWWMHGAAIFLPIVFAIPVAAVVGMVHPIQIHFPPIVPNS